MFPLSDHVFDFTTDITDPNPIQSPRLRVVQGNQKGLTDALYLRAMQDLASLTIPVQSPSKWPSSAWTDVQIPKVLFIFLSFLLPSSFCFFVFFDTFFCRLSRASVLSHPMCSFGVGVVQPTSSAPKLRRAVELALCFLWTLHRSRKVILTDGLTRQNRRTHPYYSSAIVASHIETATLPVRCVLSIMIVVIQWGRISPGLPALRYRAILWASPWGVRRVEWVNLTLLHIRGDRIRVRDQHMIQSL